MDGSWVVSIRFATCGGVIWNNVGGRLLGFNLLFVGICSILEAELWGAVEGLMLAWVDGVQVVLLNSLRELLNRDWVVYVRRIRRSANMIADGMAKLAQNTSVSSFRDVKFFTQVFSMPHDEVVYLVHDDVSPTMGVD
ncbi:hypothetical protein V6N11_060693 [Hibiscus sabdariffa]